jgi:hypothetical protein
VGANSKKMSTWEPMLEKIRNRLKSWGNKYVSLGGRITLLNSVLNAIPIFFLSFMKIPAKVVKMVIRIQRDFLWGGVGGGRKICWVKWKMICQPKSKGCLGVRDVKMVNLSLMDKWKWRLLQEDLPLWKVVLIEKYGENINMLNLEEGARWSRFAPGEPCICVLCGEMEETTSHLFLHCEVAMLIWRKVLNWLDINFITPQNLLVGVVR